MTKQSFSLEIKSLDEAGVFEGYASTFGNTDLGGDIVQAGAFAKSISQSPEVPLLWSHDQSQPIGAIRSMSEDEHGLKVSGELCLETTKGKEAYALLRRGMLKGISIGYRIMSDAIADGKRLLKELSLIEISLTPTPMNQLATVTAVKTADTDDLLQRFETLETLVKNLVAEWKGKEQQDLNTERKTEAALVAEFFQGIN